MRTPGAKLDRERAANKRLIENGGVLVSFSEHRLGEGFTPFVLASFLGTTLMATAGSEASRIGPDERVVFFDSAAHLDAERQVWIVPIHGWIYEPVSSSVRRSAFEKILARRYGLGPTDATRANFERRFDLLVADNERGKRIAVRFGEAEFTLQASRPNGHFSGQVELSAAKAESLAAVGTLSFNAANPGVEASGTVHLIGPSGVSVISDIDDTIKVTEVLDRARLLENTLLQDFRAVPDMAELYSQWHERGASIHFVSSSPWHLYEPLEEFTEKAGFPLATFELKTVRFKDRSLLNLFKSGLETKPQPLKALLRTYPHRRFVFVGDSGEHDPEVYGELLRSHPQQVKRVYIRNVTGASRSDPRFQKAFRHTDEWRWQLFESPEGLELPE